MQHLAAQVEVLVDDDHRCAKVPRPNGSGQAGAASSDDDDVGLVVPLNGLRGRNLSQSCSRRRQNSCTDAGSSLLDEIAPADSLLGLKLSIFLITVPFL